MRSIFAIAVAAIVIWTSPVWAEESNQYAVAGAGTISCGKYLDDERNQNDPLVMLSVSWVQGFLSGENMTWTVAAKKPMVILPDYQTIRAYEDKYCKDHPLDSPLDGAIALFNDLRARQ